MPSYRVYFFQKIKKAPEKKVAPFSRLRAFSAFFSHWRLKAATALCVASKTYFDFASVLPVPFYVIFVKISIKIDVSNQKIYGYKESIVTTASWIFDLT